MVRKLLKIVSVLFIIAVIVMLTIYYALFVAVSHTGSATRRSPPPRSPRR